ncbi:MAG: hypothetical protein CCU26_09140 [Nitrospira sp. UW-LDO-01]|nr:MAG: hypothetical protein CCU26_09140 [Nitrospira sp. UW-LDO-01]
MASGAEADTLKVCIARIPDAANAGQRLSAEQNCADEDQRRKTSRRHRNCEGSSQEAFLLGADGPSSIVSWVKG